MNKYCNLIDILENSLHVPYETLLRPMKPCLFALSKLLDEVRTIDETFQTATKRGYIVKANVSARHHL